MARIKPSRAAVRWIASALVSVLATWPAYAAPPEPAASMDAAEAAQLVRRAVTVLQQAALQRDVATDEHERALLLQARSDLERAATGLTGTQRDRVLALLGQLDAALRRPLEQLGRFDSPFQEPFDPPAPGRNELAVLAKQGQALLDDRPEVRPPNTDDVAWRDRADAPIKRTREETRPPPLPTDESAAIPGATTPWPQVQLRLGS